VTWTAPELRGLYAVACTVRDGLGGSDSGDTQIEVVPHRSRIVFVTNRGVRDQVHTMRPDSTEVTSVSNSAAADTFPSRAPDGAMILFARLAVIAGADTDIYVTSVAGDTQGAVVVGQSNDTEPCCLPPHGGFYG